MAVNRNKIQVALQKPYDRILFGKDVLSPVFNSGFSLNASPVEAVVKPNKSESTVIDHVLIYGNIELEDGTDVTCYEIQLRAGKRIEQNKIAIQRYVRKLLTVGQAALVNFISPISPDIWRLTLIAKDSEITDKGVKEKATHAKRFTYLLGPSESCKTAAERFEILSTEKKIDFQSLVRAFSVEKLSKAFFDEYTQHYLKFCNYLQDSGYRRSVFSISFPASSTPQEKERACKPIRDFTKKLLGRIVFLYFVQKKGWLGASRIDYKDGMPDFIMQLFKTSGGDETFYNNWLSVLFFDTLNKYRTNDDFTMPDGKKIKIPFLNGGLFDREEYDEHLLTFPPILFHNADNPEEPNYRGFFDFLNAFNFTVHEDSPDDQIVAVDPEMLGHIFENLLEDNKDKGTYYTPKEIVHYMCQESLIEYLTTHLSKEYTVYKQLSNEQVELFGNEGRKGQLKMVEELGEKALSRDDVEYIVKYKDISKLTKDQLLRSGQLLDSVKICDPAIGSGAFPMGLLQEIFAINEVIAYETNKEWKPAEVKENIIQNSVYGVDIEKGAVDIARLRFWLSLIVDEDKPRSLPNLDYKIVIGDSLLSKVRIDGKDEIIEIDWERKGSVGKANTFVQNIQRLLKEIAEKQKQYFHPEKTDKKKLSRQIRDLKIELLINQLSFNKEKYINRTPQKGGYAPTAKEIQYNHERQLSIKNFDNIIRKLHLLKKETGKPFIHFDWKLDFPEILNPYLVNEKGGFDIVVGNPPYIDSRTNDLESKDYWKKIYYSAKSGKTNAYEVFIEKGLLLLKPQGRLCFIVPIVLLNLDACKALRELLLSRYKFDEIAYGDKAVFEANVDTMIISVTNSNINTSTTTIRKFSDTYSSIIQTKFLKHSSLIAENGYKISVKGNDIIEKIFSEKNKFLKISDVLDFYNGIATGPDKEKYFSFKKINQNYKPLLMGNNIGYYRIEDEGRYINYDRAKLHRAREEKIFLAAEKIVMQRIRNLRLDRRLVCSLDTNRFYTFNSVNNLLLKSGSVYNIKYLLALLNSSLFNYLIKQQSLNTNITLSDLELLPFKKIDFANKAQKIIHDSIATIVDYVLFLNSIELTNVTDLLMPKYFIQILDGIVYQLYFSEVIKKNNRELVDKLDDLPDLVGKMSHEKKLGVIKTVFNRLNDKNHPVRTNLFYMDSIPEIRIIEGKNENN